jgi:hypothetical protein
MRSKLSFLLVLSLFASTLFAQKEELGFHFFGSASLPMGDFGKEEDDFTRVTRITGFDSGDKIGLATMGVGVGAELIAPVWFSGLKWVLSTRILINGVDDAAVKSIFRSQFVGDTVVYKHENKAVDGIDFEFGQWINIPVMTGFRYDYHFSSKYTVYGIIQAGMNLSKAPSQKATVVMKALDGTKESFIAEDREYEFARDFGFEVGVGFVLNQRYNIGFRYLALNTPRFDGTRNLAVQVFPEIFSLENIITGEERSVSMFVVSLGIQFYR